MKKWLENFVYHIDINALNFLVAIGLTIIMLIITLLIEIRRINQNNTANIL